MSTTSFVVYFIIIAYFLMSLIYEYRDIYCARIDFSKCCSYGCGGAYAGSKPNNTDSVNTLLDKINIAADADMNTIKWRRSYIVATVSTFIIWISIFKRVPEYWEALISILMMAAVLKFSFSYYSYHHYEPPRIYIHNSVEMIKSKLI